MDSHLRPYAASFFVAAVVLMVAAPAAAQGFGIGGRMAWIKNDSALDVDSERFFGGQIRLSGARIGLEVSLDRHTTSFEVLDQKVTETPIQVSVLLNLASGSFRPYLLGGPGWYYRSVSPIVLSMRAWSTPPSPGRTNRWSGVFPTASLIWTKPERGATWRIVSSSPRPKAMKWP